MTPSKQPFFVDGPVRPESIAEQISRQQKFRKRGAHAIFLGQVRADEKEGKRVKEIVYSAYQAMAEREIEKIRLAMMEKFGLDELEIFHSLGTVRAGEISLFVLASSGHRKAALSSIEEIVNTIKTNVPIWKKEILEDQSHRWVE